MTRKKWQDLRDQHLQTPEQRALYAQARADLEAELKDYVERLEAGVADVVDTEAGLADVKRRAKARGSMERELHELEQTDPEVKAARESYDATRDRILGQNGKLSMDDVRRIYDGDTDDEEP